MNGRPPAAVKRPVMLQRWDSLSFIHWRYPADEVQRLLPAGLTVDTFEGDAWVGLVPFHMQDIRPPGAPAVIPWVGTFPETNIRTYVIGPDGRPGVWFNSLDITRLAAVAVARLWYHIPYNWAGMRIERSGRVITYSSRRRWPRDGATSAVTVEVGDRVPETNATDLDHFLTARWGLWTKVRDRLAFVPVAHPRWPLHRARLISIDENLVTAAGLVAPSAPAIVHYSPGVDVRIGRPRTPSTQGAGWTT